MKISLKPSAKCALVLGAALTITAPTVSLAQSSPANGVAALFGQSAKQKFLPVNKAFQVSVRAEGNQVVASFNVTPEHYIYKDKLSLRLPDGITASDWQFDQSANMIDDPTFGRVPVFEQSFTAVATLKNADEAVRAQAALRWQGCAKAGLCYPPELTNFMLDLPANAKADAQAQTQKDAQKAEQKPTKSAEQSKSETAKTDNSKVGNSKAETAKIDNSNSQAQSSQDKSADSVKDDESNAKSASNPPSGANIVQLADTPDDKQASSDTTSTDEADNANVSDEQSSSEALPSEQAGAEQISAADGASLDNTADGLSHGAAVSDPFRINESPALAVLLLFLAGLLLSFTPCVYPMIPIVANIVARQKDTSTTKGFALSAAYGVGVASAYGALGALIAWFGRTLNIIGWLQNPVVLGVFAVLFALLALYMFDVLRVQLPSAIRNRLQRQSQAADGKLGSVGGSFAAGALSALVVSPCVSAPMAGALAAVSVSESVWLGFAALFALGLGLSVPLMLMGAAQGKFMPKAGEWMNRVKEFCGLLLLAVSLSLLERLLFSSVMLVIWAAWFALVAVWAWRMTALPARAIALLAGVWSVCLMIGAAMGQQDAWRPLANLGTASQSALPASQAKADIHITTLAELDKVLAEHDKVLVDITAEWCIECRIMERTLFTNRPTALADFQVVKLDITETNDDSKAVLARYQLFGPPALLLYRDGALVNALLGETKRGDFEAALGAV
ncbi:hypothetical protein B0181_09790 [Moraxella caviae]|uniref:Thiol:disulfide interchange protein DsbD n=1 Tax=Moraxella caviae TaxID=34060 RepID=A0A1S9ZWD2_9GAMM|nr:protein-disulfide reductase DsbD [Moraxella caviae]OOR87737.1 hypothetical protein B0181_09790 [Moraxella caviae]STZ10150.1 Thiol:disulfide interchange protein DsbD precursor [Moraxella caviae]